MNTLTSYDLEWWIAGLLAQHQLSHCCSEKALFDGFIGTLTVIMERGVEALPEGGNTIPTFQQKKKMLKVTSSNGIEYTTLAHDAIAIIHEAFFHLRGMLDQQSKILQEFGISKKGESALKKRQSDLVAAYELVSILLKSCEVEYVE